MLRREQTLQKIQLLHCPVNINKFKIFLFLNFNSFKVCYAFCTRGIISVYLLSLDNCKAVHYNIKVQEKVHLTCKNPSSSSSSIIIINHRRRRRRRHHHGLFRAKAHRT